MPQTYLSLQVARFGAAWSAGVHSVLVAREADGAQLGQPALVVRGRVRALVADPCAAQLRTAHGQVSNALVRELTPLQRPI